MDGPVLPRILCVDDNHDAADSTADLLRIVGFEVRVCYDGPSALIVAGEFAPDVCLLDLNMPGMDGDELAPRLRGQAAGRPVLFAAVTARDDGEARCRTATAGFHLHLVKPVDPHDLLRLLDEFVLLLHPAPCDQPPQAQRDT
jgi:CheY-like chemotaxis protein